MEENPRAATQVDELVETELARLWLRRGERLLLACPPIRAHVGARIGGRRLVPHRPARELPSARATPPRWPLPVAELPAEDWTDDPTLGHWAEADHEDRDAVRLADHLAASHGEARVVVTDRRVAVVCPAEHLAGSDVPPDGGFGTVEQLSPQRLTSLDAPFLGRSVPPRRVIAFGFADGSTLFACDVHAAMKVRRAQDRAHRQR
ncbi:hypothetical protein [Saccharomonospora piscinae]|uniref:hypothetical protein n=1 Tax=Saccharomonospora piscinae TaxID=687388 RepID=UPI000464CA5D|nr:hypothetical protein [Saccharomonospora piscinae]